MGGVVKTNGTVREGYVYELPVVIDMTVESERCGDSIKEMWNQRAVRVNIDVADHDDDVEGVGKEEEEEKVEKGRGG